LDAFPVAVLGLKDVLYSSIKLFLLKIPSNQQLQFDAPIANHEPPATQTRRRHCETIFSRIYAPPSYSRSTLFFRKRNPMKPPHAAILVIVLSGLTACASGHSPQQESGPPPGLQQPGRLLAMAREIQAKKGCASAIPAYRVVSSFGEGYAIAQYELGACLLETDSASSAETALFREESVLWLRRAAWAGNARAQRKLAQLLSGADAHEGDALNEEVEAMGWALIYGDNAARDLYDLPPVTSKTLTHLRTTLTPEAMKRAESFAEDFEEIKMASFTLPQATHAEEGAHKPPAGRPTGQQRRRRH
jgi:hypothetical protein